SCTTKATKLTKDRRFLCELRALGGSTLNGVMPDAAQAAYIDAVKMLSRRELSEAQIRQRLGRRGHSEAAIESAVARLREARAIDNVRVAEAIARNQIATKRRGRRRAEQQIRQAGIAPEIASPGHQSRFRNS